MPYFRPLQMSHLPKRDYFLYTRIREHFGLSSLRAVFVVGVRLISACAHDPRLQQVLYNVIAEVKSQNLETLMDETPIDPFP